MKIIISGRGKNVKKHMGIIISVICLFIPLSVKAHSNELDQNKGFFGNSFYDLWGPDILLIIFFVFLFYLNKVKKHKQSFTKKKLISFSLSLFFLYIGVGSPLHLLGDDYLFSAHMLNQALVYIAVPPLFLYGIQGLISDRLTERLLISRLFNLLTKPIISLLLFNVLFSFYHMPIIFDTIVASTFLHNVTHLLLGLAAFLMWITIIPLSEAFDKIQPLLKIAYIVGSGLLITPACVLIIFSNEVLYSSYVDSSINFLSPLEDQQTGGVIMKIFQEFIYIPIMGYIFLKWTRSERKKGIDQVPNSKKEVNI